MTSLPPGRVVGILGGGQLGRFLAEAARRLGYRTAVLDPDPGAPAFAAADAALTGSLEDPASALRLARASDLVTLEWELVPAEVLREVARERPLHPSPEVLETVQDRLAQKLFLDRAGLPQAEYGEAHSAEGFPLPSVLKRRRRGYDGKGQLVLRAPRDRAAAGPLLEEPCVWERLIGFERELSVILARAADGALEFFPLAENEHRRGVLHATRAPARVAPGIEARARELAAAAARALGHVGVMAVEMFLLPDGRLLVNEIAPRVHNSGHFTLEACAPSQFEQHLRAVCGLPLETPSFRGPAAMVNLMGDLWARGEPCWDALRPVSGLALHLYGKASARPGRKMGHYTVVGPEADAELARADARLAALKG